MTDDEKRERLAAMRAFVEGEAERQEWIKARGEELFARLDADPADEAARAEVLSLMEEMRDRVRVLDSLRELRRGWDRGEPS